jgi:hypothetical protein
MALLPLQPLAMGLDAGFDVPERGAGHGKLAGEDVESCALPSLPPAGTLSHKWERDSPCGVCATWAHLYLAGERFGLAVVVKLWWTRR